MLGKEEENYTGVQGEGNCKNDDSKGTVNSRRLLTSNVNCNPLYSN